MKKFIKYYIDLMRKYILVKLVTILLILAILTQVLTAINKNINKNRINENPISKYNTYSIETLTVKDVAERYFKEYMALLQYDIDVAYEFLDETCKNQYKNIDNFKSNIQKIDFQNVEFSNYSISKDNEQKKYIVEDNQNNIYSFIVISANKYSVIISNI